MLQQTRRSAIMLVAGLLLAACGGDGAETRTPGTDQTTTGQPGAPEADIVVIGTDSLEFQPSEVEAAAGTISVALTPEGTPHTFTVEVDDGAETVVQAFEAGQTEIGETELEAGTYTFYCAIGGHRESGMEGTLIVT